MILNIEMWEVKISPPPGLDNEALSDCDFDFHESNKDIYNLIEEIPEWLNTRIRVDYSLLNNEFIIPNDSRMKMDKN